MGQLNLLELVCSFIRSFISIQIDPLWVLLGIHSIHPSKHPPTLLPSLIEDFCSGLGSIQT